MQVKKQLDTIQQSILTYSQLRDSHAVLLQIETQTLNDLRTPKQTIQTNLKNRIKKRQQKIKYIERSINQLELKRFNILHNNLSHNISSNNKCTQHTLKPNRRDKNKFVLTESCVEDVIKNFVLRYYPDIKYKIKQSKTTKSIYTLFINDKTYVCVRLSDHPTSSGLRSYIVSGQQKKNISEIFLSNIKRLSTKRTKWLLDTLNVKNTSNNNNFDVDMCNLLNQHISSEFDAKE